MMKYILCVLMPALIFSLAGCSSGGGTEAMRTANFTAERVTEATRISDAANNPAFSNYGKLIFTLNDYYYSGNTLGDFATHMVQIH